MPFGQGREADARPALGGTARPDYIFPIANQGARHEDDLQGDAEIVGES